MNLKSDVTQQIYLNLQSKYQWLEKMLAAYDRRGPLGEEQRQEVVKTYNLDRWGEAWKVIVGKILGK